MPYTVPVLCGRGRLSCHLYQRSADIFLGVPFNIASYSLLTLMMAQSQDTVPESSYTPRRWHIYLNHIEQVRLQLSREPRALPLMTLNPEISDIPRSDKRISHLPI